VIGLGAGRWADAEARGVFGVPALFVGDELFWGHDRMDYVARAAARISQR